MASPHDSHTHGSASPAATLGSQPHHGYQQQQPQQYPNATTYDSGLIPSNDYYGKEVVDPAVQQQHQQHPQHQPQAAHQEQHQQQAQGYAPVHQQTPPPDELPPSKTGDKRICGVRRTTFLLALLAAVLLAGVIGAAAAAGVVAGSKNSNAAPASTSPAESSGAPSSSASSTAAAPTGSFTAIPLPEEPQGLGLTRPLCPGSNETFSTVEGTDLRFYHECGVNYPFNDLGNIPMTSMSDCLIQCAAQNIRPQGSSGPCIGVSWVYGKRQGVDGEACYLKYAQGDPTYENVQIESAFLARG